MGAAEHGASFPLAVKVRTSMTHQQLHDFAVGSEKNKPAHVDKFATMGHKGHAKHLDAMMHAQATHKKGKVTF